MTARLLLLSIALWTAFGCSETTPGRQVVAHMTEAHGGLDKWRSAPSVSFQAAFLDHSLTVLAKNNLPEIVTLVENTTGVAATRVRPRANSYSQYNQSRVVPRTMSPALGVANLLPCTHGSGKRPFGFDTVTRYGDFRAW